MLDHFGFNVRDLSKSLAFYEAALAPLGLRVMEQHGDQAVIIHGDDEFPFFWMGMPAPSWWTDDHGAGQAPIHLGFKATTREQVDAFYAGGIANGGRDNGAPGPRGDDYYAAYLIDPDGNNIEAGVRTPGT